MQKSTPTKQKNRQTSWKAATQSQRAQTGQPAALPHKYTTASHQPFGAGAAPFYICGGCREKRLGYFIREEKVYETKTCSKFAGGGLYGRLHGACFGGHGVCGNGGEYVCLGCAGTKCSNKRPLRCRRSDGKCFLGSGTKQYGCGESYIYTEHRRFRCNGGLQCNHR